MNLYDKERSMYMAFGCQKEDCRYAGFFIIGVDKGEEIEGYVCCGHHIKDFRMLLEVKGYDVILEQIKF